MTILAPIIVFGLIVLIHEGGHFITARSCRKGETVYSLRLIPLGGFNKIMGMAPGESSDPRAFCARPVWQRLIVISAGSVMNIFSAFLIFAGLFMAVGIQTFPFPILPHRRQTSARETGYWPSMDRQSLSGQSWRSVSVSAPIRSLSSRMKEAENSDRSR